MNIMQILTFAQLMYARFITETSRHELGKRQIQLREKEFGTTAAFDSSADEDDIYDQYDNAYVPNSKPETMASICANFAESSHIRGGLVYIGGSPVLTRNAWEGVFSLNRVSSIADEFWRMLRTTRTGIPCSRKNDFQQSFYVNNKEYYRIYLIPRSLISEQESRPKSTEIDNGWVCREALELLGYKYQQTRHGHFSISANLSEVSL